LIFSMCQILESRFIQEGEPIDSSLRARGVM
jgi:hypothetical protein